MGRLACRRCECKEKSGPPTRRRLEPYFSAVPLDDFLHDSQAGSRAFVFLAAMQPAEDGEDLFVVLRFDADAVVSNVDRCRRGGQTADFDPGLPAVIELQTVADQVAQCHAD